jgi:hypothetical protein
VETEKVSTEEKMEVEEAIVVLEQEVCTLPDVGVEDRGS